MARPSRNSSADRSVSFLALGMADSQAPVENSFALRKLRCEALPKTDTDASNCAVDSVSRRDRASVRTFWTDSRCFPESNSSRPVMTRWAVVLRDSSYAYANSADVEGLTTPRPASLIGKSHMLRSAGLTSHPNSLGRKDSAIYINCLFHRKKSRITMRNNTLEVVPLLWKRLAEGSKRVLWKLPSDGGQTGQVIHPFRSLLLHKERPTCRWTQVSSQKTMGNGDVHSQWLKQSLSFLEITFIHHDVRLGGLRKLYPIKPSQDIPEKTAAVGVIGIPCLNPPLSKSEWVAGRPMHKTPLTTGLPGWHPPCWKEGLNICWSKNKHAR